MKIVITNDDGFDAPGLDVLKKAAQAFGEVVVVAPKHPKSGAGHQVSLKTPLQVSSSGPDFYIVDGSPADCTRLAVKELAPNPDLVLAGVNPGANLGSDIYQSGTVAAVREAAILGCKGIAVSQYIALQQTIDWSVTGMHVARILRKALQLGIKSGQYLNINLPHPLSESDTPEHVFCGIDPNPHLYTYQKQEDTYVYKGIIHDRPRDPGKDVDVCFNGSISITRLDLKG